MYVCGPTVQSSPHIGHLRSALAYDLWRRWLAYRGFDVTFVRNVTDIDDKILASDGHAEASREEWWALAYRVELEFTAGYASLGILPPTYEPRATASIAQMQELIAAAHRARARLRAPTTARATSTSTPRRWPTYGELTRQKPDDMEAAPTPTRAASATRATSPSGRAASRPSPSRRPGRRRGAPGGPAGTSSARRWRSATSARRSTSTAAVSTCASRTTRTSSPSRRRPATPSRRYWVHNGLVNVGGQKMSKSLGNSVYAGELLDARLAPRRALLPRRRALPLDASTTTDGALARGRGRARPHPRVPRARRTPARGHALRRRRRPLIPDAFAAAMDDDLGVPQALAVLHDTVRAGNRRSTPRTCTTPPRCTARSSR